MVKWWRTYGQMKKEDEDYSEQTGSDLLVDLTGFQSSDQVPVLVPTIPTMSLQATSTSFADQTVPTTSSKKNDRLQVDPASALQKSLILSRLSSDFSRLDPVDSVRSHPFGYQAIMCALLRAIHHLIPHWRDHSLQALVLALIASKLPQSTLEAYRTMTRLQNVRTLYQFMALELKWHKTTMTAEDKKEKVDQN